ncbi:hypothetical protein JTB14_022793 [Gonioctena quinquepunctata]|nr:hypothetical protein JTB14_022793 [Gonioctena quinquepunctata]
MLTLQDEKPLVDYSITCSKMNYGLTRRAAMRFECEFAQAEAEHLPECRLQNESAGKDWFRGFLKSIPEMRTPEATSLSRATRFNEQKIGDFFENLKEVR